MTDTGDKETGLPLAETAAAGRPVSGSGPGVGERVGRYELRECLGRGGMGVVYRARDPHLERDIALKLLRSTSDRGTGERGHRKRLLREARALARLTHPNVIRVYEADRVGDVDFIAMELIEGVDLDRWVGSGERGWREIVNVFLQAGRGLEAAHEAGLVHRDFKPSNVLLSDDGRYAVASRGADWARGVGLRHAITGADGAFALTQVPDDTVYVVAEHDQKGRSVYAVLAAGKPDTRLDLQLAAFGALEGSVRPRASSPGRVEIRVGQDRSGGDLSGAAISIGVGREGRFRIERVPAGRQLVSPVASHEGTRVVGASVAIDIAAGETATIDLGDLIGGNVLTVSLRSERAVPIDWVVVALLPGKVRPLPKNGGTAGGSLEMELPPMNRLPEQDAEKSGHGSESTNPQAE